MLASRPDTGKLTLTLYPLLGRADSGMMGPPINASVFYGH